MFYQNKIVLYVEYKNTETTTTTTKNIYKVLKKK